MTLCLFSARAAAVLLFLGSVTGTIASTAHAQSQPLSGVVALMMADGRPHFFANGKEIDLSAPASRPAAAHHHAVAHLQTVAEALPPANPVAARDEDRAARQSVGQQADEVVEHSSFAFANHSPSIQHSVLPNNAADADGGTEVTTIRVCLGQPSSLILKSMGKPDNILAQGAKTVFVYDGIRVTFTDNKVSSVD